MIRLARSALFVTVVLLAALAVRAEDAPSEFRFPWRDVATAIAIDAYQDNDIDWGAMAADPRVAAVIHKATEGRGIDSKYAERRKTALERGYLWGSYHIGRPGDPVAQAEHYLNTATPGPNDLFALDLEAIGSDFMSVDNARRFIEHLYKKTQRYPVLYVNHASAAELSAIAEPDSVFARCPLWLPPATRPRATVRQA